MSLHFLHNAQHRVWVNFQSDQGELQVNYFNANLIIIPYLSDSIPGPSSSSDMPLCEDTSSNEAFQCLINEVNEVMDNDEYADIGIEEGQKIDESISDNDNDLMEKNTKFAEAEEKDAEVPVCSINHQYLLDFWNSIHTQIVQYGTPKCYKEGQFLFILCIQFLLFIIPSLPHSLLILSASNQFLFGFRNTCLAIQIITSVDVVEILQ
ncbi:hypothetical protein GYMLUDRAFT_56723 [Collybiopsis luxurians FD-317 M1]|nr:hypothetical protein GYMLUDRAFT_56723 [Collybiopsis luxurians FD-317 M1]